MPERVSVRREVIVLSTGLSLKSYYSALALHKIGRRTEASKLLHDLLSYARRLAKSKASVDYFATSLPTMLLFDDDPQPRQATTALFLECQALLGLGRTSEGKKRLRQVLARDPNHALAADLSRSSHF